MKKIWTSGKCPMKEWAQMMPNILTGKYAGNGKSSYFIDL